MNLIKRLISKYKTNKKCAIHCVKHSKYFTLSTTTSYTEEELIDYAHLTGKKLPEIEKIMETYMNNGIHSLWQINQIIKMGHYCG